MLHTVVRAYVESYGVSLTSSSLPPHRPDTILFPGIAIKDSATSAASVTPATSLSFPLKGEGSSDITAIKQHLLTYNTNNTTTTTPTAQAHTTTPTTTTHTHTDKGGQNYVPSENIIIKNTNFIQLIEGEIKNNIIYQFCNNLEPSLFEVKLLGGRLFECSTDSNITSTNTDISTNSGSNNSIGTAAATIVTRDVPTSLEVARNKLNYDQFCGTICIQVREYTY